MSNRPDRLPSRFARYAAPLALAALALVMTAPSARAEASCQTVIGHYVEQAVSPQECTSPVGLCIVGQYSGMLKGEFEGAATSLIPTADTPTTGALLFTSDSVIHARIGGKEGDLFIKNAGVFRSVENGDGEILDLQFITGGTSELAGASGALRASGIFNITSGLGESEYIGSICLP